MPITLRPIDHTNWRACLKLKVTEDQRPLIADNAFSLVQAAYSVRDVRPYGIYAGEKMVGFVMFALEKYEGKLVWSIDRVMVDANHQGRGYGGQGIRLALELMQAADHLATDVYISFLPENDAARHVYSKLGFVHVGKAPDGHEELMHLSL